MAALRVPGVVAARARRGHHLRLRHPPLHRHLLPGDAARVQALQGVQHDGQQHQDRGGRGARRHRSLLHSGDVMHHLVHVRAAGALPGVPVQVRVRQGHHEHDRPGGHHTVLHHAGDDSGGEGGEDRAAGPGGAAQGGQQPGHVAGHPQGHQAGQGVQDIQAVQALQGAPDPGADAQGLHAGAGAVNVLPIHR